MSDDVRAAIEEFMIAVGRLLLLWAEALSRLLVRLLGTKVATEKDEQK